MVNISVLLALLFVRVSIYYSMEVSFLSYYLYDYQYSAQEQCDVSPTLCVTISTVLKIIVMLVLIFCWTIDTLVKTSVLLVLLFVGVRSDHCDKGTLYDKDTSLNVVETL